MSAHLVLKEIIEDKRRHNPRMSLRWIAARMGVSSGRLSEILNAKRPLTEHYVEKICTALKLPDADSMRLRRSLQNPSQNETKKNSFGPVLDESLVEKMADWKPFALMSFFQTTIYQDLKNRHHSKQEQLDAISKRINIPVAELASLIEVMTASQLIGWASGQWSPTYLEATTGFDIPSRARLEGHVRDLSLAQEKIRSLNVLERDFSAVTLTMDPRDLGKAKRMIRNFRRSFTRALEKGPKKGVYRMSIQFFPVVDSDKEIP